MKLNRIILVFTIFISCSPGKGSKEIVEYKYFDELNKYLSQQHSINVTGEEDLYLLVIPVGSCTPCVEESLEMGIEQRNNKELKTVLMADNKKMFIDQDRLIKQLNSETTYYDNQGKRNDFETGVFSPVIFHFINGDLVYFKELSVSNIHEVKKELEWI